MWEISEGDSQYIYAMKLVPPKDLGCIALLGIIHLKILFMTTLLNDKHVFAYGLTSYHSRSTIELLEANRTRNVIAQAYTHTQRLMNNVWSGMVSCSSLLCLSLLNFRLFFGSYKTIWENSHPTSD